MGKLITSHYSILIFAKLVIIAGCATPNVWIQSRWEEGGAIGYQNYNPSSDNMAKIRALIPCTNFKMIWNGHKSSSTGAVTYMYSSSSLIPLDDGVVRWTEYHYQCLPESNSMVPNPGQFENRKGIGLSESTVKENTPPELMGCVFIDYCNKNSGDDIDNLKSCIIQMCSK